MGFGLEMGIQALSALKQSLRPQEAGSAQLGRKSEKAWPVGGEPAEVDKTEQLGKEVGKSQTAQDRGCLHLHVTQALTRIHSATTHMYAHSYTCLNMHAHPQHILQTYKHIHRCRRCAPLQACEYINTSPHIGPYVHICSYVHTCTHIHVHVHYVYIYAMYTCTGFSRGGENQLCQCCREADGLSSAKGPLHLSIRWTPMTLWGAVSEVIGAEKVSGKEWIQGV